MSIASQEMPGYEFEAEEASSSHRRLARADAASTSETPVTQQDFASNFNRAGQGYVQLSNINGRTVATRLAATSPLKLLNPRIGNDNCAWIFTSTYGGGLVGGDSIRLTIDSGPATKALISTQASTKIYRTTRRPCSQRLDASVSEGALLVCWPDPIVCFAGAKYEQKQRFDLHSSSSSLVMIDWLTSGRRARGERWAFDLYRSQTEIFVENRCALRDAILLDPADGPLDARMRMGLVDCFATIVVIGNSLKTHVQQLLEFVNQQSMPGDSLLFSASPFQGGVVLRIAGPDTEGVAHWIRERLSFITELVGHNPWARKW